MTTNTTPTTPATPAVRALAARRGVNLATVHGTGAGGRITTHDVNRDARATDDELYAALFGGQGAPRPANATGSDDALYAALFPDGTTAA